MQCYMRHWLVERLGFRTPKQAQNDLNNEKLMAAALCVSRGGTWGAADPFTAATDIKLVHGDM